jgi:hypothetical protein
MIHRGKDISFSGRSFDQKLYRLVYKFCRILYVTVVFYFVPFGVLFVTYYFAGIKEEI